MLVSEAALHPQLQARVEELIDSLGFRVSARFAKFDRVMQSRVSKTR